ncbi:MAG: hypothetical protein JWQ66_2096 [Mucilaginibacter sp.]|nr:hypothetical protein [Mucilaginibacter sp.]
MELTEAQLTGLISKAAELATIKTLIITGNLKPYLKKSEAFRLYGRKNIEKWLSEKLLTLRKDGDYSAALRLDRLEIESLVNALEMSRILVMP